MVNEWLHAELGDETPVTTELRRMFQHLGATTDRDRTLSLTIEQLYLLTLSMRWNTGSQPCVERENR